MRSVVPKPIPVVDDPMAHLDYKPRHRGRLHQLAFLVSVPAVALLVLSARTRNGQAASAIYGFSVTGLFFTSSLYNRLAGTPRMRSWMRWLDHSMIYVLIAGSYTPVCWLALTRNWSVPVLSVVWIGALAGIVLKMTSLRRFRRVGGVLYLAIGWFALIALPKLFPALTTSSRFFLVTGGAAYMIGAVLLWLRRPNPTRDFGYHEVWHGFVVVGAVCHFAMTWLTVAELG
jgi:hemolysin III